MILPYGKTFSSGFLLYTAGKSLKPPARHGAGSFHFTRATNFLLLAHSEYHYRRLGSLVAKIGSGSLRAHYAAYERIFMEALAFRATAKKHRNVLEHMLGYFSDRLSPAERRELTEAIGDYRSSLVPLIAPLTLIRHYVDKYGVAYLSQ
jgi:uncharacterized protein YbgA (DUF1722 family)